MRQDWWKNAVVYQIYPKSFKDSNRDGIGDLRGIIEKLDYIKDLGADIIWLCPVYESPMDDNGYDISDYYHINPMFGSDADMEELLDEAEKRNMKILMDLVVNHTSDEHKWFEEALKNPASKYRNYYVFREGRNGNPPNNWRSYFGGSAWEKVGDGDTYYLHLFSKKQPDLNWENKEMREDIYCMINYWLDKGLAGFRVDAICNIKKNIKTVDFPADGEDGLCYPGPWVLNQPGIEIFLKELKERTFHPHNSMTVAEANVPDELLRKFIGDDGFFSMVFDFSYTDIDVPETGETYIQVPFTIAELRDKIFHSQQETQKLGWGALYLENHDQCRSLNKYLPENEINYESATMLAALFMLLRGTPFIYQGEEIGMVNCRMEHLEDYNDISAFGHYERARKAGLTHEEAMAQLYRRSRDNARTPFQWDDSPNAGFTDGETTWIKVNENYTKINVKEQSGKERSVLQFYKKLIYLRRQSSYKEILVQGEFAAWPLTIEDGRQENVIAYQREYQEEKILVICNFQKEGCPFTIPEDFGCLLLSNYEEDADQEKDWLRPYECRVLSSLHDA